MELKELYEAFRDKGVIEGLSSQINDWNISKKIKIMEVCGGHTHTIMKYGLNQLISKNVDFIHGPGCPVCVLPKKRIDYAYTLSQVKDVILVTLGDMIKVPGSLGSLQHSRSLGHDVRFVYSPIDILKIAIDNPSKKVIFFAIGFETTTPMSASLLNHVISKNIKNLFFLINHITIPEVLEVVADYIDGFLAPSHVSVISGAKIYLNILKKYNKPIVVTGFEPVDVLSGVLMVLKQKENQKSDIEIEYSRCANYEGNRKSQELIDKFFKKRDFEWRGLGVIKNSGLTLKEDYKEFDCEEIYRDILPTLDVKEPKNCLCGEILKGLAKPNECKLFGTSCTPDTPIGSCMVSSEGACYAYFRYSKWI